VLSSFLQWLTYNNMGDAQTYEMGGSPSTTKMRWGGKKSLKIIKLLMRYTFYTIWKIAVSLNLHLDYGLVQRTNKPLKQCMRNFAWKHLKYFLWINDHELKVNKNFWEYLFAYSPSKRHGPYENDASKNSSTVTRVFVAAVTFPKSRCLARRGG
jgi:hypothetical protein